jgi:hypothetical protein
LEKTVGQCRGTKTDSDYLFVGLCCQQIPQYLEKITRQTNTQRNGTSVFFASFKIQFTLVLF